MSGLFSVSYAGRYSQTQCRLVPCPVMSVQGVAALDDVLAGKMKGAPRLTPDEKKALSVLLVLVRQLPVETLPFVRFGAETVSGKRRPPVSASTARTEFEVFNRPRALTKVHAIWGVEDSNARLSVLPMPPPELKRHMALARKVCRAIENFRKTSGGVFFERVGVHADTRSQTRLPSLSLTPIDETDPWPAFSLYAAVNEDGGFLRQAMVRSGSWAEYLSSSVVFEIGQATLFSSLGEALEKATGARCGYDNGTPIVHQWTLIEAPVHFAGLAEGMLAHPLFPGVGPLARQQLDDAITKDEVRRKLEELDKVRQDHPEWFEPAPPPRLQRRL
jgi:hypothetical protein